MLCLTESKAKTHDRLQQIITALQLQKEIKKAPLSALPFRG
jgi:hypothetical protein